MKTNLEEAGSSGLPAAQGGADAARDQSAWLTVLATGKRLFEALPLDDVPATGRGSEYAQSRIQWIAEYIQTVLAQRQLILDTLHELLGGKAGLWISNLAGIDVRDQANPDLKATILPDAVSQEALFTAAPAAPSLRQASELRKTIYTLVESPVSGDASSRQPKCQLAIPVVLESKAAQATGPAEDESPASLGVMICQRPGTNGFSPFEITIAEALAGQLSLALQTTQRVYKEKWRQTQLTTLFDINAAITAILDQGKLLDEIVNLIQKKLGYPYIQIYSVHHGRRKIFFEAGSTPHSLSLRQQQFAYNLDVPEGIIPWTAKHAKTFIINDVAQEPLYRPSPLFPEPTRSELCIPLCFDGEVIGILDLQSDTVNAFHTDDRFLFEALADYIAIAMHNANLYRSEQWRRQVADSLREVAGLLTTAADLDQVLQTILAELERTLPCDLASIWLTGEIISENNASSSPRGLRLAAIGGPDATLLDIETGATLEEVIRSIDFTSESHTDASDVASQPYAWFKEALEAENPTIRAQYLSNDPLVAELDYPVDYSAIAAPLRIGQRRLGLLILAHHTANRYGSEARMMTAAFASYAAVAIENSRLYEQAHDQAWVSTVLLQVSEATQSFTDLEDLLDTVSNITPKLAGVKACLVYVLDEDRHLIPAASAGLTPLQQIEFIRQRFMSGQIPSIDRLLQERHPFILHDRCDSPADRQLFTILNIGNNHKNPYKVELLLMVPMVVRNESLGVFLVNYSHDQTDRNRLEALEELFGERLAIIQGIAHQTATAVENIRLLKSQQEEAYISVALLQVAQAVVSTSGLEDILGAIVRITPILIGVKRAVIFLWDEQLNGYRLTQSYGLPRSLEYYFYPVDEFPLLAAVHTDARLFACPIREDPSSSGDTITTWKSFSAPEPDTVEEFLESEGRLLLVFPLSIKNNVLGAFVIEEPTPPPADGLLSANTNRRLRSKRMEITTGICQQAALAIQNDQFQRERVMREGLEREMQLAHEIQRAFLPHRMPELPGWELDARWLTAREVGGDFYDFIELPGNQLGLVIADVADKGIPAALFMTLTRTLIRATAREYTSPGEVLKRVNDLLTADAQQGMFVTLIYAILSLDNGQLVYANSGHNCPVLIHVDQQELTILPKGQLALGINEGVVYQEHTYQVKPGDYLVFYTDGITEAFSPQDAMFGEHNLYQTIHQTIFKDPSTPYPSAKEILDTIDQSVRTFIQDAPRSDDLTLFVLRKTH